MGSELEALVTLPMILVIWADAGHATNMAMIKDTTVYNCLLRLMYSFLLRNVSRCGS
jgi:hypothetical protein